VNDNYRLGAHEPRNVWHDPKRKRSRPLSAPVELTGVEICFARDEQWAATIRDALNLADTVCGHVGPLTDKRCVRKVHPASIPHDMQEV